MASTPPVACTLRPGDFQDRLDAWRELIQGWLVAREPIPGGIRLVFGRAAEVEEAASELLRLEADCCPWMQSALQDDGRSLLMDLTGDGPQASDAVMRLFGAG